MTNSLRPTSRLTFFSIEAFPLSFDDLARAHAQWPEIEDYTRRLRQALPPSVRGLHTIDVSSNVRLQVFYGDVADAMAAHEGRADAWFLDGFAPSKNPAMWSPEIMMEIGRHSTAGASFSTFTVAGAVKRGLQAAGFETEKRPGFGRKREMLSGKLVDPPAGRPTSTPWFHRGLEKQLNPGAEVGIIGGGVAGASLFYACKKAGLVPTVFEQTSLGAGASGNPVGIIMPRLDLADTPPGRFHLEAYLHVLRLIETLERETGRQLFDPIGVDWLATGEAEARRFENLVQAGALPSGWMEQIEAGLHFPQAGALNPLAFLQALMGESEPETRRAIQIDADDNGVSITFEDGSRVCKDAVIIANGRDALRFSQMGPLPISGSAGQVDYFSEAKPPHHVKAFGPYAAPAPHGGTLIGATYASLDAGETPAPSAEATQQNIDAVTERLPELGAQLTPEAATSRVSVRCVTPDRMPIAGALPDWEYYAAAYDGLRVGKRAAYPDAKYQQGLFALTGLGSRGLMTAPLAADLIVADMSGGRSPVDVGVANALHPARFFVRALKRSRATR